MPPVTRPPLAPPGEHSRLGWFLERRRTCRHLQTAEDAGITGNDLELPAGAVELDGTPEGVAVDCSRSRVCSSANSTLDRVRPHRSPTKNIWELLVGDLSTGQTHFSSPTQQCQSTEVFEFISEVYINCFSIYPNMISWK